MKRMIALMLVMVSLVAVLAACGGRGGEEVTIRDYTDATTEPTTQGIDAMNAEWFPFATLSPEDKVTVLGLCDVFARNTELITVDDKSVMYVSYGSGEITAVYLEGDERLIPVKVTEAGSDGLRTLYAKGYFAEDDPNAVDLGDLNETTTRVTTTRSSTTTKKPASISGAQAISTTKKPVTTTDEFQSAKEEIIKNIDDKAEQDRALKLLSYKMDENGIFYTEHEPWQKQFGFNALYDMASPMLQLVYGTIRIKFTYDYVYQLYTEGDKKGQVVYDAQGKPTYKLGSDGKPIPKNWLIQLWKGRYGLVMLGAEIGAYTKESTQAAEHYNSAVAEEEIVMAVDCYQHNFKTGKTTHLFTRGPASEWWLTGFVPGAFIDNKNNNKGKDEIIVVGNLRFPTEEMLNLFASGMEKAGFSKGSPSVTNVETYTTSGTNIKFSWQYIDQDK